MLTAQRISELLVSLRKDKRQTFLAASLRYRSESEHLCFDITSVSSCSTLNQHVKYDEKFMVRQLLTDLETLSEI